MILINTYTHTYTYTQTRIDVIDIHFELFLTCAEIPESNREKILKAVNKKELSAVGIYIEDDNFRIAEVAFEIDWDEHQRMIGTYGTHFDTNLGGWKDGVAPEAYISVQHLVEAAKKMDKPVCSWITVSPSVYSNPLRHKALCDELGYSYESSPPPWKGEINTSSFTISHLSETKITNRCII